MATLSSVLAWRIPGTGEPGGLPSPGSHRVRHDWSDLAATPSHIISLAYILLRTNPGSQLKKKLLLIKLASILWKLVNVLLLFSLTHQQSFSNSVARTTAVHFENAIHLKTSLTLELKMRQSSFSQCYRGMVLPTH